KRNVYEGCTLYCNLCDIRYYLVNYGQFQLCDKYIIYLLFAGSSSCVAVFDGFTYWRGTRIIAACLLCRNQRGDCRLRFTGNRHYDRLLYSYFYCACDASENCPVSYFRCGKCITAKSPIFTKTREIC